MSNTGVARDELWPAMPLEDWRATKDTVHRLCQMLGKVRMELSPFQNHWWHVTLHVDVSGLTTGPVPLPDGRLLECRLDLREHRVEVSDSTGAHRSFDLDDTVRCAGFLTDLLAALAALHVEVAIDAAPYDLDGPRFDEDQADRRYDREAAARYWRVLATSAGVLREFAGWFNGKQSPVHLFWHSFDLAHGRFSGRRAPDRPGASLVEREAYSHEVIAFGFWPGDDVVTHPAYYSYTAPAPEGLLDQPLRPTAAAWDPTSGTAVLPYDAVRTAADPASTLLEFLQSSYLAGATTAGWDVADLTTRAAPPGP